VGDRQYARHLVATGGAGGGTFDTHGNNVTLASAIGGPGQLLKSGNGELTLNGTNTYSDGTLVTGGTLLFTSDANLGAAGTGIFLKGGAIGTTREAVAGLVMTRPLTLEGSTANTIDVNLNPLSWAGGMPAYDRGRACLEARKLIVGAQFSLLTTPARHLLRWGPRTFKLPSRVGDAGGD
jgi:autotransporter-associated beta strand protein